MLNSLPDFGKLGEVRRENLKKKRSSVWFSFSLQLSSGFEFCWRATAGVILLLYPASFCLRAQKCFSSLGKKFRVSLSNHRTVIIIPAAGSKPDFRCALKTGVGYFTDDTE